MGWFDFLWKRDIENPQQESPGQDPIVDDVLLQALLNGAKQKNAYNLQQRVVRC